MSQQLVTTNELSAGAPLWNSAGFIITSGPVQIQNGNLGQVIVGADPNGAIEIGQQGRGTSGSPYIDFHSAVSSGDYDVRIQASGGTSAATGLGTLNFVASTIQQNGANTFLNTGNFTSYGLANTVFANTVFNGFVYATPNASGLGLIQASQYYRLNQPYTGNTATVYQGVFGVGSGSGLGVTLSANTVYEFEVVMSLTKSAGTTSHAFTTAFGGSATINNIYQEIEFTQSAVAALPIAFTGSYIGASATITSPTYNGAITSASYAFAIVIKGTVSINAGGTFIPQYILSANPGGAYTTQIGSYMKISPLASGNSNTAIGTWR